MKIQPGKKYLITTDGWFLAPDGNSYRAVFGTVGEISTTEDVFGFRPRGRSTNWFVQIGNAVLAGCQIHYAIRTDTCSDEGSLQWSSDAANGLNLYRTPSHIYFADTE